MRKKIKIKVYGKVQGVCFWGSALKKAESLHVRGLIKNTRDGNVKLVVEGEQKNLEEFVDWCYIGPENAIIKRVNLSWHTYKNEFDIFEIIV